MRDKILDVQIKICGLTSADAIVAVRDSGADMAGFVFFEKSPRYVTPHEASALAKPLRGKTATVALVVDATNAALDAIMAALNPDFLQLHGLETPQRVADIAKRYQRPVIKALGIKTGDDTTLRASEAQSYHQVAWLLLDAKPPKDATRPGGNGVAFDWTMAANIAGSKPYFLSGGLTPDNVTEALRITHAPGLDVSSGVESRPGVKDPEKIFTFIARARNAAKITHTLESAIS